MSPAAELGRPRTARGPARRDTQSAAGAHPEDVAAALGLHRKTVYAWLAKYREGGEDALRAQPVPGRPPKLGGPQLSRLYALIAGQDGCPCGVVDARPARPGRQIRRPHVRPRAPRRGALLSTSL
jgi:hypothetical protein